MNKNKRRALAVLLGLISMGKSVPKSAQCASAGDYSKYLKWGGIGAAGAAGVALPLSLLLYFGLRGKKSDVVKPDKKDKNIDYNYPFKGIIPFYQWQNGNCFFLSSLYTLFGPENMNMYEKVAKMQTSDVTKTFLHYLSKSDIDAGCQYTVPEYKHMEIDGKFETFNTGEKVFDTKGFNKDVEENKKKSNGFIELCKLFVRQQEALKLNPDSHFQIVPSDFKDGEIAFEEKICHGEKLLDRNGGSGAFYEVLNKFTVSFPFVQAFGDKSLFANWSPSGSDILKTDKKDGVVWQFNKIEDIKIAELGAKGNPPCSMDENGKVTINGKNYYLVSMAQTEGNGEGHIICDQPKYKIIGGEIKTAGLLKLSCYYNAPRFQKYSNMTDIFKSYNLEAKVEHKGGENANRLDGAVGFAFRFAPEEAIKNHQDYYCYND